jgi:hypothetical protein
MEMIIDRESLIFNPPQSGCVLYMPGIPGAGNRIYDRSHYGNHGDITGAIWKKLPGGLWYLSFDGTDDFISVGNRTSLNFGDSSFTIQLWLLLKGAYGDLIGKYNSSHAGKWGFSVKNTATIRFYTADGSRELAVGNLSSGWQFLAFVIDRKDDKARIYQQGKLRDEIGFTPQTFDNNADLTIGKFSTPQWGNLSCEAIMFSIHRLALSGLEIQDNFNLEKHLFGVW